MGTIPVTVPSRRIKYLGTNFPEEVMRDVYSENCKTLQKEIQDHTNISIILVRIVEHSIMAA